MTRPGGSGRWPRRQAAGRVRAIRDGLRLTQVAFAEAVGCSVVLVAKWEGGTRYPSWTHEKWMTRLAAAQQEQEANDAE